MLIECRERKGEGETEPGERPWVAPHAPQPGRCPTGIEPAARCPGRRSAPEPGPRLLCSGAAHSPGLDGPLWATRAVSPPRPARGPLGAAASAVRPAGERARCPLLLAACGASHSPDESGVQTHEDRGRTEARTGLMLPLPGRHGPELSTCLCCSKTAFFAWRLEAQKHREDLGPVHFLPHPLG